MTEITVLKVKRKVWRPSRTSKTLVISLPSVDFLQEGDKVDVLVTSQKRIIIRKHE